MMYIYLNGCKQYWADNLMKEIMIFGRKSVNPRVFVIMSEFSSNNFLQVFLKYA